MAVGRRAFAPVGAFCGSSAITPKSPDFALLSNTCSFLRRPIHGVEIGAPQAPGLVRWGCPNRQVSTAVSSSLVSIICRRSPRGSPLRSCLRCHWGKLSSLTDNAVSARICRKLLILAVGISLVKYFRVAPSVLNTNHVNHGTRIEKKILVERMRTGAPNVARCRLLCSGWDCCGSGDLKRPGCRLSNACCFHIERGSRSSHRKFFFFFLGGGGGLSFGNRGSHRNCCQIAPPHRSPGITAIPHDKYLTRNLPEAGKLA